MLKISKHFKGVTRKQMNPFGGGHGLKQYDWRDDQKQNQDLYQDPRGQGWKPLEYTTPYSGPADTWLFPGHPENYDHGNLKMVLRPDHKKSDVYHYPMTYPYWNIDADIAHEFDYESEDYDFQAESFSLQHFRKKGPISQWIFVGFLPLFFFWNEFIAQHYPDEDYYRMKRPPPLNYPDREDTDDTDTYEDYQSYDGKLLRDTGLVGDLWYDIKDNKKVYKTWAGVNQPMDIL